MKVTLLKKLFSLDLPCHTSDLQRYLSTPWYADGDESAQAFTEMLPQSPGSARPTLLYHQQYSVSCLLSNLFIFYYMLYLLYIILFITFIFKCLIA